MALSELIGCSILFAKWLHLGKEIKPLEKEDAE